MHGQQENRDLSGIYSEGVLTRAGANIAGLRAKAGQAVGNLISGDRATTAAQAGQNAKVQYAYKAAAKNLINDLQKLGALPKGNVPQSAALQAQSAISNMAGQMQPTTAQQQATTTSVQTAPTTTPTPSPATPPASPASTPAVTDNTQQTSANMDAATTAASAGSLKDIERAINLTSKTLSIANASQDPQQKKLRTSIAFQLRSLQDQRQKLLKQQNDAQRVAEAQRKLNLKQKMATSQQLNPARLQNASTQLKGMLFKEFFKL